MRYDFGFGNGAAFGQELAMEFGGVFDGCLGKLYGRYLKGEELTEEQAY